MQLANQAPALDAAISRYQGYLQADPGNPHLLLELGDLYQRCGKLDNAMTCYEQCARHPAVSTVASYQIGKVRLSQQRYQDAERCFRTLIESNGADASLLHCLGISLFHQHRWDDALTALNQARTAGVGNAENAAYRTKALHQVGQLDASMAACEEWLAHEPCEAAYAYLALLRLDTGDMPQAHELAHYVLQRDPANADAALVEWVWHLEQHADEQAQRLLSVATKPETVRAWLALALQRAQQCDAHSAWTAIEAALSHIPQDAEAATTLGWTQLGSRNFADAKCAFDAALRRNKDHAEAHVGLALALILQCSKNERDYPFSVLNEVLDALSHSPNGDGDAVIGDIARHIQLRLRHQIARTPYFECASQ